MNIMVSHDGSKKAQDALEKAVELFIPMKPKILLLTVVEAPADASSENEGNFKKLCERREEDLRTIGSWVVDQGLEADVIIAVGDPRRMILEATKTKSPDVLVVAKRGGGLLDEMVLGSVSAYLIRHASCPVLVMHC